MPRFRSWISLLIVIAIALSGCRTRRPPDLTPYADAGITGSLTQIESPDVEVPSRDSLFPVAPPRTIRDMAEVNYWDITLEDTVRTALVNSKVLRDLGGTVVRSPETTTTSLDPAIQETDPRFGVEGALSAFDAQLQSCLLYTSPSPRDS